MKFHLPLLLLLAQTLPAAEVVSVLAPLAYGEGCWSTIDLRNLTDASIKLRVAGHKASGALVELEGASQLLLTLRAGERRRLVLRVEGEHSREGWVEITEAHGQGVAISGASECLVDDKVVATPQSVAYPTLNPWLKADASKLRGHVILLLNTSPEPATAKACYSNGSSASNPRDEGELVPICTESLPLQIPPFGLRLLPVAQDESTRFSIDTLGSALVLRALIEQPGTARVFKVDSTIRFGQPID